MRRPVIGLAPIALLFAMTSQGAVAAPCATEGSKDAKELALDPHDEALQDGLDHAFQIGLTAGALSEAVLRSAKSSCSRGKITAAGETLEILGENTDSPSRWTQSELTDSPIIFMARIPRPEAALKKLEAGPLIGTNLINRFAEDELMYVVAVTHGPEDKFITHFFDKIPDDQMLRAVFTDIMSNRVPVKVGFHVGAPQVFKPQNPKPKN